MIQNTPSKAVPNIFLIAIFTHIFACWGYLELTDLATLHLKHNSYMSLLMALPFILPFIWIIYDLATIFPGMPATYIIRKALGKWIGNLVILIYIPMLFAMAILCLWESQLMVGSYFFVGTDIRVLICIMAVFTLYPALHRIESVGRLATFTLVIPLLVIYGLHFLGLPNVNLLNLKPVFEGHPRQWFESGFDMLFLFMAATAAFPYLAFFKKPQSVLQTVFISLGLVVPLFFLTIFGTGGVWGPAASAKITWPAVEFFHLIDLPILFIEQAGLFFIVTWSAFVFITISQAHFIIGHVIQSTIPAVKLKWAMIASALVTAIVAFMLPQNIIILKQFIHAALRPFTCAWFSIIFITWVVTRLRRLGKDR